MFCASAEATVATRFTKTILSILAVCGLSPLTTVRAIRGTPGFIRDYVRFRRLRTKKNTWPLGRIQPCFGDKYEQSGVASGHYFHQDLLVARRVFERNPRTHVDIGSRIDGFVAHVASFRKIIIGDIRPLDAAIPNVSFVEVDLMSLLPDTLFGICDSLSCLHALEHFGLGRYGDRIDPEGYRTGFLNLSKMLMRGGTLYLSVPIGPQRIEFNAHRVFSVSHLLEMFGVEGFEVKQFSYVDDAGKLHENQALGADMIASNCGVNYGCGIFELTKMI